MQAAEVQTFPSYRPSMVASARVVSICPWRLRKQMSLGLSQYTFDVPAQDRNAYHIFEVTDSFQMIRTNFEELSDSNPTPDLRPAPIPAHVIASSLVAEWGRTLSPVGNPGVRVMPLEIEEGSEEFKAMLREMTGQLRSLAEWAIRDAGDKFGNNEGRHIQDGFHRVLARWLMGEEGARAIPWYNAQAIDEMKKCIACGDSINYTAKVCKSCGTDLVDYFKKYAFEDTADPVVAAMVKKIRIPAQTEATKSTQGEPLKVTVNIPTLQLPADVRQACVTALSAEQKADMQKLKGQDERDNYLKSLIPDLCMRNQTLKETLTAKGYVISNSN